MIVEQVPVLADNYVHLVHDPATGATAAVDPAVAGPVLAALKRLGWRLTHILCTHHHGDHVGGVADLKAATGARTVGARKDAHRLPPLDEAVGEGDRFRIGDREALVLEVPGHTRGHVAYWFEGAGLLFPGDTLFSLGCGRLFEGTAEEMWDSLCRLRALPDATLIYPAHEYTNANADFALTVDPGNPDLIRRAGEVLALREAGRSSLPSTLAAEKACNPFLRAADAAAFADLRRQKDVF
ncbi:MAG: hydroxyacylglutathione hydrolase [Magnetospirillum sp. WYHS-4]